MKMDHRVEGRSLKILVAVKPPPLSESTVKLAVSILQFTGGRITLLSAQPKGKKPSNREDYFEYYTALIHPYPVELRFCNGDPSEEISNEAAADNYDLVVLGKRPENLVLKYLFSRRAENVLNHISCPVLIASQQCRPLRRFLVCEGGRSTKLLPALTDRLAALTCAAEKVIVLHVMSQFSAAPDSGAWELSAEADDLIQMHTPEGEQLNYDLSTLHAIGVNASVKVRHGIVVEEIQSEAEKEDVDVIVMGAPRAIGLQRFLLDSPIHEIILKNQRTVMLVG